MDQKKDIHAFVSNTTERAQGEQTEDMSSSQLYESGQYLSLLLFLLISVSFFEGYDEAIASFVLPALQDGFRVSESSLGLSQGLIGLGLFFAFFFTRLGDRIGRRQLLIWSVLGYTLTTILTVFSWDLWSFTFFQFCSRVFLGAEYAVAITMVVEEFPVGRRATALGRLLMLNAFGILAVALFLLVGIANTPLQWRLLYLIGIIPLLLIAYLRRRLKETRRFTAYQRSGASGTNTLFVGFWEPWRSMYRNRLIIVGIISLLRAVPLYGSIAWFFYYAQRERAISSTLLYLLFILAFGLGMAGYHLCGYLMERLGRRHTALIYLLCMGFAGIALYQSSSVFLIGICLLFSVVFGMGAEPLMGALATELFPTAIRNQAAGWTRNVFQIAGFMLGPILVGVLGDHTTGILHSVGNAEGLLCLLVFPAFFLAWRFLPETRGKELEEMEVVVM